MPAVDGLLEQEIEALKALTELLTAEQAALKAAEPDRLPALDTRKAGLIRTLNELERERNRLIEAAPEVHPRAAMQAWLARHAPASGTTAALWEELLSLAREAKALNALNGKLVALHLHHTSQALAAITPSPAPSLYGRDGQSTALTGSRIIDSA